MEGATKWDPVSLKASEEAHQLQSRVQRIDRQVGTASVISSLEAELNQAQALILELETERQNEFFVVSWRFSPFDILAHHHTESLEMKEYIMSVRPFPPLLKTLERKATKRTKVAADQQGPNHSSPSSQRFTREERVHLTSYEMAFSSIPTYNLDTCNWQQFPNHQLVNTGLSNDTPSVPPIVPPSALQVHGPRNPIRPVSMTERARLANIPMPEASLKCPRCESTNTKFCYFNNYSLSQPRHFCKTCRRYWTRGGALRNVPVGGGSRKNNKRSNKSNKNRSKSPATDDRQTGGIGSTTNTVNVISSSGGSSDAFLGFSGPVSSQLRFMAPNLFHHLGDNFGIGGEINGWNNYGDSSALNSGEGEKMFLSRLSHLSSVKLENNIQEPNLSRQFWGMGENQQRSLNGSGTTWMDRSAGLYPAYVTTSSTV
ncbi:hypothetical protein SAY87_027858 [Trapa incisa]|uniref:Dof zinc finger protein n=1 Tax=Trapa incisa TaxID=236973 RepID=A0AAN7KUJ3_9MYRT|nr:hypothetical protein SAY87_027858 [Trapa incisa]